MVLVGLGWPSESCDFCELSEEELEEALLELFVETLLEDLEVD